MFGAQGSLTQRSSCTKKHKQVAKRGAHLLVGVTARTSAGKALDGLRRPKISFLEQAQGKAGAYKVLMISESSWFICARCVKNTC